MSSSTGDNGEDFVEWACQQPLGKDFLFRGQKYRVADGNEIELCDLLLLLDDIAILMEVKTADRGKRPNRTEEDWIRFAKARRAKALRQIKRGVEAMQGGLVVAVENERQGTVPIDPAKLRHYFGVAIIDHPTMQVWGTGPTVQAGTKSVSVLATAHAELEHVFTELSTAGDLLDYLQAREEFFETNQLLGSSELDLLATFKARPSEFRQAVRDEDLILIAAGTWDDYAKLEARGKRAELDPPSLLVDALIDRMHESRHARLPHIERRQSRSSQADSQYAKIAVELAKMRRIDRRVVGECLIESSNGCIAMNRDRWFVSTPQSRDHPTFVFLISTTKDREVRSSSLERVTLGAMIKCDASRIIGIATEPVVGGYGFSLDAMMIKGDPDIYSRQLTPQKVAELMKLFGEPHKHGVTEFGGRYE